MATPRPKPRFAQVHTPRASPFARFGSPRPAVSFSRTTAKTPRKRQVADPDEVRVYAKQRPLGSSAADSRGSDLPEVSVLAVSSLEDGTPAIQVAGKRFPFDEIFLPENGAKDVQKRLTARLVPDIMETARQGYDINVLCYGQTGSGKTLCTMDVAESLFEALFEDELLVPPGDDEAVSATSFQIYGEEIMDLFENDADFMAAVRTKSAASIMASLIDKPAETPADLLALFRAASSLRSSRSTASSPYSSRSHLFFRIKTLRSTITLVDLAGSEDPNASGAFKEGVDINKALLALGRCIAEKRANKDHVPWRDHLLTKILETCLGTGGGRLRLVACTSPFARDMDDTINTLRFASRARGLVLDATINIVESQVDYAAVIASQNREIAELRAQVAQLTARAARTDRKERRQSAWFGSQNAFNSPTPSTPLLDMRKVSAPFDLQEEATANPFLDMETDESGVVLPTRTGEGRALEDAVIGGLVGASNSVDEGFVDDQAEASIVPHVDPAHVVEDNSAGDPSGASPSAQADEGDEEDFSATQDSQLTEISLVPENLESEITLHVNAADSRALVDLFKSLDTSAQNAFVEHLATKAADLRRRNITLLNVDRIRIAGGVLGIPEELRRERGADNVLDDVNGRSAENMEKPKPKPKATRRRKENLGAAVPSQPVVDLWAKITATYAKNGDS